MDQNDPQNLIEKWRPVPALLGSGFVFLLILLGLGSALVLEFHIKKFNAESLVNSAWSLARARGELEDTERIKAYLSMAMADYAVVSVRFLPDGTGGDNIYGLEQSRVVLLGAEGKTLAADIMWNSTFAIIRSKGLRVAAIVFIAAGIVFVVIQQAVFMRMLLRPMTEAVRKTSDQVAVATGVQMVAHDLRKPISMMSAFVQAVQKADEEELPRVIHSLAPHIGTQLERAGGLISDLLVFGSRVTLQTASRSLYDIAEQSWAASCSYAGRGVLPVLTTDFRHSRRLLVDERRVERVLTNLLTNAIQAACHEGQEGNVWISTRDAEGSNQLMVRICIGNTGRHIPADLGPRLFQLRATFGKKGGTGLGLAIVRKLVEAHGGELGVDSDAAHGTEFWVTLPAAEELDRQRSLRLPGLDGGGGTTVQAEQRSPTKGARTGQSPRVIAIIDDDPFVVEAWRIFDPSTQVQAFDSPDDFVRRCGSPDSFDLIITDFYFDNAPGADGHTVVDFVRGSGCGKPVVVSSSGWEGLVHHAIADGYIDKQPTDLSRWFSRI